jgi:arginine deiminase
MSMISGLIDKLRKSEQEWNQSNMFELAHMCHEAADTILELRDDLQRANAENAKLRELCKKLYRLADESYVPFKDVNPWMNEFDNAIRAMRELGVEV